MGNSCFIPILYISGCGEAIRHVVRLLKLPEELFHVTHQSQHLTAV